MAQETDRSPLSRLGRTLFRVFETVAIIAFVAMLVGSVLQVIFRHFVPLPIVWTEEAVRLLNVVVTYLGAVVLWQRAQHIRIDYLERKMPWRARAALSLVLNLLMGWFMVVLAWGCWLMVGVTWNSFATTIPWLRMAYVYAVIGIGSVGVAVLIVRDMTVAAVALVRGTPPADRSHAVGGS